MKRYFKMGAILLAFLVLLMAGTFGGHFIAFMLDMVYLNIIYSVSLYALLRTGVFSLAHAAFMSLGAYSGFVTMADFHVPFEIAVLVGGGVAATASLIVGIPMLRLKGVYFAIGSIVLVEIVRYVVIWMSNLTRGHQGFPITKTPTIFGIPYTDTNGQYILLILSALVVYFFYRLFRSHYGYVCRSSRDNEALAASIGIASDKYKQSMFTLTAFIVGATGVIQGGLIRFISPDYFPVSVSIFFFVNVLVGGTASILGPIIGAIFMTFLGEPFRVAPYMQNLAYATVLLLVILFLPEGLLGVGRFLRIATRYRGRLGRTGAGKEGKVVS